MMKKSIGTLLLAVMVFLINPQDIVAETLKGEISSSRKWGSGWLDLSRVVDFQKGDKLELQIGGTANRVLVRLLAQGVSPESPSGIVGGAVDVPPSRTVELQLDSDYNNIIQISVHGHSNPWGLYDLGAQNGPATLLKVDYSGSKNTEPKVTEEKQGKYQRIQGGIGSSRKWGSGWLDLSKTMNFKKGDRLKLQIGGTANKILVRLLPKGISPDSPSGIVGGAVDVPPSRTVELQLDSDYNNIIQISVHGHSNPWGLYDLGAQNGPATLLKVDYSASKDTEPEVTEEKQGKYQRIQGEIGSSRKWGSGWLDLSKTMNFQKGDRLKLQIGGTANKILVRLLPKGISPDSPSGIVGGPVNVPPSRIVELRLDSDYNNIIQISVHGHSNPWGLYDLGAQNGPATLLKVDYSASKDTEPEVTEEKQGKYQRIQGEIGSSRKWGSGWLDLSKTMNFQKGDKLKLQIGGTANKILVRLLAKGISPDSPSGIVGGPVNVPPSRIVELRLDSDYNNIIQISVHGHSNPWNLYDLGAQNGPATLLMCEYSNN